MNSIECSVWNNGGSGWGLRVLGGLKVRHLHFRRSHSPVLIELDGKWCDPNVDKDSFWNENCGELIRKPLSDWINKHNLRTGDLVWLEVLEPHKKFRAILKAN